MMTRAAEIVNLEATPDDAVAEVAIRGKVGEVLPKLIPEVS